MVGRKVKTKQELIEYLKDVQYDIDGDEEDYHIEADRLLLEYIDDKEVSKAFHDIPKWYS